MRLRMARPFHEAHGEERLELHDVGAATGIEDLLEWLGESRLHETEKTSAEMVAEKPVIGGGLLRDLGVGFFPRC